MILNGIYITYYDPLDKHNTLLNSKTLQEKMQTRDYFRLYVSSTFIELCQIQDGKSSIIYSQGDGSQICYFPEKRISANGLEKILSDLQITLDIKSLITYLT